MELVYVQASNADIDNIYFFSKQLITQYEDMDNIDFDRVIKWVKNKIETSITDYIVVMYNNEKVAYYKITESLEENMIELDDLYVLPQYRNKGIGTEILKKIISEASRSIFLYVFVKNYKAINLYFRMGFEIQKNVHFSRYIMEYKSI